MSANIPDGVTPLVWAETKDEHGNSRFEAISKGFVTPDLVPCCYWRITPVIRNNAIAWTAVESNENLWPYFESTFSNIPIDEYGASEVATMKEICEATEIALGGLQKIAPSTPVENPDQSAPHLTDANGFAPTREIRARWSRNNGVLYLSRLWRRPDNGIEKLVDLHGEEYETALFQYGRQHLIQSLVARIIEGWTASIRVEHPAIGRLVMECEVHFVNAVKLLWEKPGDYDERHKAIAASRGKDDPQPKWTEYPAPTQEDIMRSVGDHLNRERKHYEKTLAGTSIEALERQIRHKARQLGMKVDEPTPRPDGGNVLPMTLENMQAEGIDLRGKDLKS